MRKITLSFPYYENPMMFEYQWEHLRSLPREIRDHLEVIVVDDGSPARPLIMPARADFSFRIFRTLVDIPWNISFVRNLGVKYAAHDWILTTDIDHVIPAETLHSLMTQEFDVDTLYLFRRRNVKSLSPFESVPYHLHSSTCFISKQNHQKAGGEDERLRGYYSVHEYDFQNRIGKKEELPLDIFLVGKDLIADASTTTLERKNDKKREEAEAIVRQRDRDGLRPLQFQSPYCELTRQRSYTSATPQNTAVCTILAYPGDENIPTSFGFMQASCQKFGIHLHWFLAGQQFLFKVKEIDMSFENKISRFWDEIDKLSAKFKYILFVDARDVLFVRPLQVVCDGYNRIGWPILMSATRKCSHHIDPAWQARFGTHRSGFNFLNSGMWMAERGALATAIKHLRELSSLVQQDKVFCSFPPLWNNDQHLWQTAYVERTVPIRLDHDQEVFNNFHQLDISEYDFDKSSCETPVVLKNGSKPAILHFAGQATVALPFVAWTLNIVPPGVIPSKLPQ